MRTDPIYPPGMWKCCATTVLRRPTPGREGDIQACVIGKRCNGTGVMIFTRGAWRWNGPKL